MTLTDCHTHTQFSVDSEADITQMIERAISLGLSAYAITDHCECNCWYPKEYYENKNVNTELYDSFNYKENFESSLSAVTKLKEKYSEFNLICGTELGQCLSDIEVSEKAVSDSRLDFVIASLHQIKNEKDFYYIDYFKITTDEIDRLLEKYFMEIYELCKWGKFDVLGHLTYCIRYMKRRNNINPNLKRFEEIIAESLRILAQNGRGIEINTSGIRHGLGTTLPSLKYVKLFRELGGTVITTGSDAHKVDDVGADIGEGVEIAKAAGFSHICYFKNRKPYFLNI